MYTCISVREFMYFPDASAGGTFLFTGKQNILQQYRESGHQRKANSSELLSICESKPRCKILNGLI